ncbi:unnamed protein product, partial [Closterium sp. NIES-54]
HSPIPCQMPFKAGGCYPSVFPLIYPAPPFPELNHLSPFLPSLPLPPVTRPSPGRCLSGGALQRLCLVLSLTSLPPCSCSASPFLPSLLYPAPLPPVSRPSPGGCLSRSSAAALPQSAARLHPLPGNHSLSLALSPVTTRSLMPSPW